MAGFNRAVLLGRLTADPELKQTVSGVSVTSFTLAVDRRYKNGEEPQADFIPIVCWRQTAEFVSRYFRKGSPILVCGSIQVRKWTDKDGQNRYATEVVADEVSFTGSKESDAGAGNAQSETSEYKTLSPDDELPF